jgi:hypothetical protein
MNIKRAVSKVLRVSRSADVAAAARKARAPWEARFAEGRYRPGLYGTGLGVTGLFGTDTVPNLHRTMHEHHPGSAFRANVNGRIQALEEAYLTNFSHMGRRGARTGMLVGTLVGTVLGIVMAVLSLGVGIPLLGVLAGIGGQVVGFLLGLGVEKFVQARFARKHPEIIKDLQQKAEALRQAVLLEAEQDPSYDPQANLRRLDFFTQNLEGRLGQSVIAFVAGMLRESPSYLFELCRDFKDAAGRTFATLGKAREDEAAAEGPPSPRPRPTPKRRLSMPGSARTFPRPSPAG